MLVRRLPKLLPYSFSFQRVRNIIPFDPVFPEQDSYGVYRPIYEKRNKLIKTPQQMLQTKMNAIVSRAKKLSKVEHVRRPLKTREEKNQYLMELFKNILIDNETGLPLGLGYDEYVKIIKNKSSQHKESKYLDNLQMLIRKLGLANESDLAGLHKHFIADMNKGKFQQQARIQFLENLIKEIDKLKAENKLEQFLSDNFYLDKQTNSKEFILTQINQGRTGTIEHLIKQEVTDEIGRDIALKDITVKVAEYREIKSKLKEIQDIDPYKEALKGDPLYDPNHTLSEQSDLERLEGQRYQRDPTYDEELTNDPQYFKTKDTISLFQRNYFRNKIDYFKQKAIEQSENKQTEVIAKVNKKKEQKLQQSGEKQEIPQIIEDKLFNILATEQDDILLQREAESINESLGKPLSYEEIYERIDFILQEAPEYLQELAKNKKECDQKSFNPQTLQSNFNQSDLLWDQFNKNFPILFPYSWQKDENFTKQKNSVSQDPQVIKEESLYALELYKEFQKPQNEKFFKHYLTNYMQFKQDELEQVIRQNHESLQPTNFKEDYTKFMEEADEDFEDKVIDLEDLEKNKTVEDYQPQDILSQFADAKDEYYTGRGRRKSCQCTVKITKGYGKCTVNGKDVFEYMPTPLYRHLAMIPIELSGLSCYINVEIRIRGSGVSSQSDAIAVAITRALVKMCPGLKKKFRDINLTKTDRREVERKHTGLLKARKKWPYNRR